MVPSLPGAHNMNAVASKKALSFQPRKQRFFNPLVPLVSFNNGPKKVWELKFAATKDKN
jgi:hypothetical protein